MQKEMKMTMAIRSDPHEIHRVEKEMERFLTRAGLERDDIENLGIAVTEMVNNAIHHGNKNDRSKRVVLEFRRLSDRVEVVIEDCGGGFDPQSIADPLQPENLFKESGRGIFIVRALMDKLDFRFSDRGTRVTMIKYFKK